MFDSCTSTASKREFRAELTKLNSILGHELLAELLEISAASLQRYQSGQRDAPNVVADRAHFLTSVTAALEGTLQRVRHAPLV
jgi:hypothetical protein